MRYETASSQDSAPATVACTLTGLGLSGTISQGQTVYRTSEIGVNGVKAQTSPSNLYGGTVSVSGAASTDVTPPPPPPPPPPQPATAEDCKGEGWQPYGFRNQGQCVRYVNTGKDSRAGRSAPAGGHFGSSARERLSGPPPWP